QNLAGVAVVLGSGVADGNASRVRIAFRARSPGRPAVGHGMGCAAGILADDEARVGAFADQVDQGRAEVAALARGFLKFKAVSADMVIVEAGAGEQGAGAGVVGKGRAKGIASRPSGEELKAHLGIRGWTSVVPVALVCLKVVSIGARRVGAGPDVTAQPEPA